jgi:hypothetical protein
VNGATEIAESIKIIETGTEIIGTTAAMAGTLRPTGILTEAIGVIGGLAQGTAQGRTETVQLADVQTT